MSISPTANTHSAIISSVCFSFILSIFLILPGSSFLDFVCFSPSTCLFSHCLSTGGISLNLPGSLPQCPGAFGSSAVVTSTPSGAFSFLVGPTDGYLFPAGLFLLENQNYSAFFFFFLISDALSFVCSLTLSRKA